MGTLEKIKGALMRILVTGTGARPGRLIAEHLETDHDVTAVSGLEDIRDPELVGPLLRGVNVIVHAGAILDLPADATSSDVGILDWAARGSYVLLSEAVRTGVERAVLIITLSCFEDYPAGYVIDETFKPQPRAEASSLAPLMAEKTFREFSRQGPIQTVCLRFGDLDSPEGTPISLALESISRAVEMDIGMDGYRWEVFHVCGSSRFPLSAAKGSPLVLGKDT